MANLHHLRRNDDATDNLPVLIHLSGTDNKGNWYYAEATQTSIGDYRHDVIVELARFRNKNQQCVHVRIDFAFPDPEYLAEKQAALSVP